MGNAKVQKTATDSNTIKLLNVACKAISMFLSCTLCADFSQCRL